MSRRGDVLRLTFRSLDKRNTAGVPQDSLSECLNCVIHRDGRVARRPSATLIPVSYRDDTLAYSERYIPFGYEGISGIGGFDTIPSTQYDDVRLPTYLVQFKYGYDFTGSGDTYGYLAAFIGLDTDLIRKNMLRFMKLDGLSVSAGQDMLAPGWNCSDIEDVSGSIGNAFYGHSPASHVIFDSAVPGSDTNYEMVILANGHGIVQTLRNDEVSETMTPIELSGADPAILEMAARARILCNHKNQMFYAVELGTVLIYSKPGGETGGPRFFQIDRDNNWIKIESGSDSPITNLISYADSLLVITKKSTWRITGNFFDRIQKEKLFDIGCPSPRGMERINISQSETETRDANGRLIFINQDGEIVITDGIVCQSVSDPVWPILSKLHSYQIENAIVRKYGDDGLVIVLWPNPDLETTHGVIYDYYANRWVGEVDYGFEIAFAENMNIRGKTRLIVGSRNAFDMRVGSNSLAALYQNVHKFAFLDLTGDDTGADLYWRGVGLDASFGQDYAGLGVKFRTKVKTQPLQLALNGKAKGLRSVIFDMEPLGDWKATFQIYPDGLGEPVPFDCPMLGGDTGQYGIASIDNSLFAITKSKQREYFYEEHGDRVASNTVALGIECEPADDRTETIEFTGGGGPEAHDIECANFSGFLMRGIELSFTDEKTFTNASHAS